jgi:hypothetical protein
MCSNSSGQMSMLFGSQLCSCGYLAINCSSLSAVDGQRCVSSSTTFCTCPSGRYAPASVCCDASRSGSSSSSASLYQHDSSSHLTASRILPSTRRHRPTNKHSKDLSSTLYCCPPSISCNACGRYALHTVRFAYSSDGKTSATCRTALSSTLAASPHFLI